MEEIIYHYTVGNHLDDVLQSGELIVSDWERKNKVRPPALWLSLNAIWENTATKLISDYGTSRRMTKMEQFERFGLVRFSIPFNKASLCSWGKYKYKSNTPSKMYNDMEKSGIEEGADPKEWFASFKNIQLSKCISCEKWNGIEWELFIDFKDAEYQTLIRNK